jgi:predicted RNase H-like HicB family nuclease
MAKISNESAMRFNVLIKKVDGCYIAHCLELDIVATAKTKPQVCKDITDLVQAAVDYAFAHDNLDYLFRPAHPDVWKEFYECKDAIEKKSRIESRFKVENPNVFIPPWLITRMCLSGGMCA